MTNKDEGFIVHPFETGNNKYHASYDNHNKTVKSFNTLRDAKKYLKTKGYNKAMYDSPTGVKTIKTTQPQKCKTRTKNHTKSLFGFKLKT